MLHPLGNTDLILKFLKICALFDISFVNLSINLYNLAMVTFLLMELFTEYQYFRLRELSIRPTFMV